MTRYVKGAWHGWKGHTVVELTDGTKWKQTDYFYEYRYAYQPEAVISNGNQIMIAGMSRSVRVKRHYE